MSTRTSLSRLGGGAQLAGKGGRRLHAGELLDREDRVGLLDADVGAEDPFRLAATDGEVPMRRYSSRLLLVAVIGLELGRHLGLLGDRLDLDDALLGEQLAHGGAHLDLLGQGLGDDVARAGERRLDVGDLLGHVDEGLRLALEIACRRLLEDAQRQRLEATLAGDHRAGAALRLVREVQVLELALHPRGLDLRLELRGQLSLLVDLRQDGDAAVLHLGVIEVLLLDGADLHLVEPTGLLLAVAGDEGDGRGLGEQLLHRANAGDGDGELGRDAGCGIERGRRRRHRRHGRSVL
jgi:hypothetical protein